MAYYRRFSCKVNAIASKIIFSSLQPTLKAQAIAPSILAALHQIRQAVELSQTFNPLISDRDFAIGSSDYTSLVLLPSLLAFSHKNAPNLNYRMIGFEKDAVGELLEQGAIDVALGVFSDPPRQTLSEPLFTEHFVGIARQDHPALVRGTMDLESFAKLPHALFTLRRDAIGEVDRVLAEHNLQRRIALTTPHLLVLPSAIAKSDLVATVPYRIALHLASFCNLSIFELPINTKPWMVSMIWSTLSDRDEASCWLRQSIKTICQQIN